MRSTTIFLLLSVLTFCCCSSNKSEKAERFDWNGGVIRLDRINDSLSIIRYEKNGVEICNQPLPWPVYRFTWGDINEDSVPEVAVGVIKETPFWHQMDRRLFIYQLYKGQHFVPLWKGSHVASKLEDFYIDQSQKPAMVRTLEIRQDRSKYEAEYYLGKFGLKFKRYVADSTTTAKFLANHKE
ncbi:MAG: nuclear receptor-binding factor 2 [Paludibacteraceae bacterium]|nr:nuclear receptor-binding factor 2 [Paludibacteraceae bacterium]MBR6042694.1 nuclear receptor-binding factor 2 [Paludibacteraceae bacterium]